MLAKQVASMRKRCRPLEFVSFSNSKGSDWYRRKTNRYRKGYRDTKKGMSEEKVGGNLDQWVQCDNCKNGECCTRQLIFLSFQKNGIVVLILIRIIIRVLFLKK